MIMLGKLVRKLGKNTTYPAAPKPASIKKLVDSSKKSPTIKAMNLGTPHALQPTWTPSASKLSDSVERARIKVENAMDFPLKRRHMGMHEKPGTVRRPLPGASSASMRRAQEQANAAAQREVERRRTVGPTYKPVAPPTTERRAPAFNTKAVLGQRPAMIEKVGRLDVQLKDRMRTPLPSDPHFSLVAEKPGSPLMKQRAEEAAYHALQRTADGQPRMGNRSVPGSSRPNPLPRSKYQDQYERLGDELGRLENQLRSSPNKGRAEITKKIKANKAATLKVKALMRAERGK